MLSSKVSIGDTATASQYNNLREDVMRAGYYLVEELVNDDTLTISEEIVGDSASVVYVDGRTSIGYFEMQIPELIDTSEDWLIRITFDMNSSDASKAVRFQLDYNVIINTGDTTPASFTDTLNETVSTPDTLDTLKVTTFSTIKIAAADLVAGALLTCRFSRLGSDGADTHTGDLRLLTFELYQDQT